MVIQLNRISNLVAHNKSTEFLLRYPYLYLHLNVLRKKSGKHECLREYMRVNTFYWQIKTLRCFCNMVFLNFSSKDLIYV